MTWFDPTGEIHRRICQGMFARAALAAFHGTSKTVEDYKKRTRWKKLNYCLGNATQADESIYCGFQEGLRLRNRL